MEKENKPQPAYYAVIPATVRYDKNVPAGAKLLYGEISSLSNKKGCCWAGNAYFADLYQASERTVINWINTLKKCGYISVSFSYVPGKKEIESRFIRLTEAVFYHKKTESGEKTGGSEVVKISSPPSENNFTTYGKNFQEVVKIPSKGGEKNCVDNIKNNIKNTTTTAASEQPELIPAPPLEKVAAAAFSPEDIKKALLAIDRALLLRADFYSRASAFMSLNYLDSGYLAWLYKQCELRNPDSFDGMFFTLFFAENMAEKYKILKQPAEPPPPPDTVCPVCGTVHDRQTEKCPLCSLPKDSTPQQIALFRELLSFPPDKRNEYLRREDIIFSTCGKDFQKAKIMKDSLIKEFGIKANYETPSRSYHP
ncbi:MAG: helix-turn-helix domain-containing protein [Treponema sp.]|jgi:hypothetical protein|nr:helix-turn-helix domain-containing protein [Treponema sp.]